MNDYFRHDFAFHLGDDDQYDTAFRGIRAVLSDLVIKAGGKSRFEFIKPNGIHTLIVVEYLVEPLTSRFILRPENYYINDLMEFMGCADTSHDAISKATLDFVLL